MIVIWVTGTKGKTTVSNIIAEWLQKAGKKVCMFSTANLMINGELQNNNHKMTSPSPFVLWKFLKEAKKAGCNYAVIETSSHAIHFHRNYGLEFDVAVLTNISQDHLDLHGTMEHYVATKQKLFTSLYSHGVRRDIKKVGVVNADSQYASEFINKDIVVDSMYTYWLYPSAQIQAKNIIQDATWMHFDVRMPSNSFSVKTSLAGTFNVYNILAAICVLISQKVEVADIQKIMNTMHAVPGRMEYIPNKRWVHVVVDYAHTEDSLDNVLATLRERHAWRIITVFWATGDRDTSKRPKMGKVVEKHSDIIILTDDDTYTEDSSKIIRDVVKWITRKEGEGFWIIPEREDAIRTALMIAKNDDVVLVAGKWSETVLVTNQWSIPWNDKKKIEEILMELDAQVMV